MLSASDYPLTDALKFFSSHGIDAAFLVPTEVGLGKSIMDATIQLRIYLKDKSIHDYDGQPQGDAGKVKLPSYFVTEKELISADASLYRPFAKGGDGDPRIWFSRLKRYASPNNLLAIVAKEKELYIINISNPAIRNSVNDSSSPLSNLFHELTKYSTSVSEELTLKLKDIAARGWIRTITPGDTGVGVTLEDALGLAINSSKKPDYKGIELKSKRISQLRAPTRSSLFAQVPNWNISKLKSSAEILDTYGYMRGKERRLYCTVWAKRPNSQGLVLKIDDDQDLLNEYFEAKFELNPVATWEFEVLRRRLITKHNETFWIGAECIQISGIEHFQYKKVIHTRSPIASNLMTLLQEGIITVDHLIKRNDSGSVREKGPLFKISPKNLGLLFPPSKKFDLI